MESALKARLPDTKDHPPTAEAAAELAKNVKGHWTTYLAFRKSPFGIGFRPPMFSHSKAGDGKGSPGGPQMRVAGMKPNGETDQRPSFPPDVEEEAKRARNDHFARLTPEQRVLRERKRLAGDEPAGNVQIKQ